MENGKKEFTMVLCDCELKGLKKAMKGHTAIVLKMEKNKNRNSVSWTGKVMEVAN